MTELFLNSQPAVLPDNLNIKVVRENTYFTKSGSYTHNIALPLAGCAQNQRIFEHIHRADKSKPADLTLHARLVCDNIVLIAGTATILEISEKQVQIQILSGNAEMNFFEKMEGSYIDELPLGGTNSSGGSRSRRDGNVDNDLPSRIKPEFDRWGAYPDSPHVFIPVFNENDGQLFYEIKDRTGKRSWGSYGIQPYLCTIIGRVVAAIGYTLEYNALEDTFFKNLIICNADWGLGAYAPALPHWTVTDFFTQLENTFGLVVEVSEDSKAISLVSMQNYIDRNRVVHIDALDEFTCKVEKEVDAAGLGTSNIGFKLSDSETHQYKQVAPEILKAGNVVDTYKTAEELIAAWNTELSNKLALGKKLFLIGGRKFISYTDEANKTMVPLEIDQYGILKNNPQSDDVDVELKIVPVGMRAAIYEVENNKLGDAGKYNIQVPSLPGKQQKGRPTTVDRGTSGVPVGIMQEMLENGGEITTGNGKPDIMQVAFYDGTRTIFPKAVFLPIQYPVAWTDYLDTNGSSGYFPRWSLRLNCDDDRIHSLGGEVFRKMIRVNARVEEKKRFTHREIPDVRSVFVVSGRQFLCKQIEITVTATGMDKVMEATLYEMEN